ncbi:hypothetical protein [Agarivorans albus]|uniref:Lipoprotein n=1 Tax=Agarivorans albus MKT 106 TaxID=1331007 RepID=R9PGD8_AGAAL|nr:hypothetical protein [Agarivorans albus]GAD00397.1 hypothetical protein AALB_0477 [Agarivorans albus MKT 106]
MSVKTPFLVFITIGFLTSCSTFRPHSNPYKTDNGIFASCIDSDKISGASQRADFYRCHYTNILNDRVSWDRGSGIAIATALAVAGYKGITDGSKSNIAGLLAGAGGVYAVNQILALDKTSAVYAAGIKAISCVEAKYPQVSSQRSDGAYETFPKLLSDTKSTIDKKFKKVKQCNHPYAPTVESAYLQLFNHLAVMSYTFSEQDAKMSAELNHIDAKVKAEVNQLLPNIESIYKIASTRHDLTISETPPLAEEDFRKSSLVKNVQDREKECYQIAQDSYNADLKTVQALLVSYKKIVGAQQGSQSAPMCELIINKEMQVGDGTTKNYELKVNDPMNIPVFNADNIRASSSNEKTLKASITFKSTDGSLQLTLEAISIGNAVVYVTDSDKGNTVSLQVTVN